MTTISMQSFTKLEPGKTIIIVGPRGSGKSTMAATLAKSCNPESIIVLGDKTNSVQWKQEGVEFIPCDDGCLSIGLNPGYLAKNKVVILDTFGFIGSDRKQIEHELRDSAKYNDSFIYVENKCGSYENYMHFDYVAFAKEYYITELRKLHKKYVGKSLEFDNFVELMMSIKQFEFLVMDNIGVPYWAESLPESIRVQRRCRCFRDELVAVVGLRRVPPVVRV